MSDGKENGQAGPVFEAARDKALWARTDFAVSAEAAQIDPLLLSAYIDGRLGDAECDAVEAFLAASPEALESLISARASLSEPAPAVPESLVKRAQGLIRAPVAPAQPGLLDRFSWLLRPAAWTAAATATVLLGVLSFQLGQTGYQQYALDNDSQVRVLASVDETDRLSWRLLDVL